MNVCSFQRLALLCFALILGACATAPAVTPEAAFTYRDGIGLRDVGPDPQQSSGRLIRPAIATPGSIWHPGAAPDAFSRMDELFGTSLSSAGPAAQPFRRASNEWPVRYSTRDGGVHSIDDYMNRNAVTGLLVARGDEILLERYQYGRHDRHRMTSFSMAKTVIALLIGIAVEDGKIVSIDDRAERYVSDLTGSEYGATPLRHLLTMSSGVRFREEYDAADDAARLSRGTWQRRGSGGAAVARQFNERLAQPGQRFYYASAETFVLALVLRAATGESVADYFSRKVWQPLGAEDAATWLTDATGQEVGYAGLNARVRDFARLAMMMARGGMVNGHRIVSEAWIREMTTAHVGRNQTRSWFAYGYQTWIFPPQIGSWAMLGVRGQAIYVDPGRRLVMVHTAARALARDPGGAEAVALWLGLRSGLDAR